MLSWRKSSASRTMKNVCFLQRLRRRRRQAFRLQGRLDWRGGADVPTSPVLPAQMYRLLRANAETLGYSQDYTVSALTELLGLL